MTSIPKQFAMYWCNLEPTFGHQMKKTRPCVVVSPDEMNELLQTAIIVPLTSTIRSLPFYIPVGYQGKKGALACDQIKTIDQRRIGETFAVLKNSDKQTLSKVLCTMFSI
jgi:mRNA interferase MazF